MRKAFTRILLVPVVATAAIAFAAPPAQAGGQWGGGEGNGYYGHGYGHDNDGILDSLFQCGLLSLLLGGCDPD
jgi:hypothetical protein